MTVEPSVQEVSVSELKKNFDNGTAPIILDVREPHELKIASLPKTDNTIHIPLNQLPGRLSELAAFKAQKIVVYCRSGGRSLMACNLLKQSGFSQTLNLKGGVLAWSKEIDPSVQQY